MQAALETWEQAQGARHEAGRARDYGDVPAEYRALREGAGLWTRPGWSLRTFVGDGRLEFLHKYCTQEVRVPAGRGAYGCVLTVKGATVSDLWVYVRSEELLVVTPPATSEALYTTLGRFALFDKVTMTDAAGERRLLSVCGPQAESLLADAFEGALPAEPLTHAELTWTGQSVIVAHNPWFGVPGYDLVIPEAQAAGLLDALQAAGARPVGEDAVTQVRVEEGVPLGGAELGEGRIPVEAGLDEQAINYDKGCYLGQEVIARIKHRGRVNRHLRGLRLTGAELPETPTGLFVGPKEIGRLTSATHSPRLSAPAGLGIVHRKHAEPGTELRVGAEDGPLVTVCALPLAPA